MNLQATFDIPEICYQLGIRHAVISPGSRNGALTIAFSQHGGIECLSVPDERSAAFIALGISLKSKVPSVLICTSGSAGLNYFPAIAEAFFNRVPMLVLTADRPPELIDIRDGQTIFQREMYGKHVRAFFDISVNEKLDDTHKIVQDAIQTASWEIQGPVHINLPFEEPFYPDEVLLPSKLSISKKAENNPQVGFPAKEFSDYQNVLIIVGQESFDLQFIKSLSSVSENINIPVISDVIGNVSELDTLIRFQDLVLKDEKNELKPDLVITFGLSVLSKNLKNFLRNNDRLDHWHVDAHDDAVDTFGKLKKRIHQKPEDFLCQLLATGSPQQPQIEYFENWQKANSYVASKLSALKLDTFTDACAYQSILSELPANIDLHLANSMAVRYINYFGLKSKTGIEVFCNRGTSGIDGSNSTAVGTALVSNKATLLITGDMAFLYDRNAFWHNHVPENLKIIVINNEGGGIFRLIKGPSDHEELEPYFETQQKSTARHLSEEFGFDYFEIRHIKQLKNILQSFFRNSNRSLLEIFTNKEENETAFRQMIDFCS